MPRVLVPDTSVLVSGRLSRLVQEGELKDIALVIPEAVVAELEHQAVQGRESGVTGIDEIAKLQELVGPARLRITFAGPRPHPEDLELGTTELRGLVRNVAQDAGGEVVTSDRVQAHVSKARGLKVWYLHPYGETEAKTTEDLELWKYFDAQTMSVHLKVDCKPLAKKGTPGQRELVEIGSTPLKHADLSRMTREIIEAARRNPDSFLEIERTGATVCQLGPVRVAIARPPFSDGIEITAVRPVAKLSLDDYKLPTEVIERIAGGARGIFVSGPPGSGKSTFAQAVADFLLKGRNIVKTMESPRDLQVEPEITQYAPLDGSMALTSDVLLLVRPDYVIFDEVRKTEDFVVFADMRLAGVGLIGATHANRAIDAIQRLLNRVDLGMIPQVVDTVVHIQGGRIEQILEIALTVKVPEGMVEQDLARPVVVVKDFATKRPQFEIYTYGEQTIVMPIEASSKTTSRRDQLAESQLVHLLQEHIDGDYEVRMKGANEAQVFVQQDEIARLIGTGGTRVKALEQDLGVKIEFKAFDDDERRTSQRSAAKRSAELRPQMRRTGKHLVLVLEPYLSGKEADVCIDGEPLFQATIGRKGEIRVRRHSPEGEALQEAHDSAARIGVRV